ncbi:MAG: hypothetical protein P8M30_11465 [Planctomycetaceae bacterium]|nr:hypothetical protein [Planctomycetaceae bacterium]
MPVFFWVCLYRWRSAFLIKFFAGYCLIANGAYIGAGSFEKIEDCREMLIHETPIWVLWLFGISACSLAFYFWNGLGPKFGCGKKPELVSWKLAISGTGFSAMFITCSFLFGNRG